MKRRDFIDAGLKSAIAFTIVPRRVLGGNGFIAPSDKIQVGFISGLYWCRKNDLPVLEVVAKCCSYDKHKN